MEKYFKKLKSTSQNEKNEVWRFEFDVERTVFYS